MTEIKEKEQFNLQEEKNPVAEIQQFWSKHSKQVTYGLAVIVLVLAGFLGYKFLVQEPNETKASSAMFHAEEYYRNDSARLALNGDNVNAGFLSIISKYSGTRAANLAQFYAGSCYLKMNDYNNAVKHLKEFSTSVPQCLFRIE